MNRFQNIKNAVNVEIHFLDESRFNRTIALSKNTGELILNILVCLANQQHKHNQQQNKGEL